MKTERKWCEVCDGTGVVIQLNDSTIERCLVCEVFASDQKAAEFVDTLLDPLRVAKPSRKESDMITVKLTPDELSTAIHALHVAAGVFDKDEASLSEAAAVQENLHGLERSPIRRSAEHFKKQADDTRKLMEKLEELE